MVNFTPNSSSQQHFGPSERTLNFIRQYAYAWNQAKASANYQN